MDERLCSAIHVTHRYFSTTVGYFDKYSTFFQYNMFMYTKYPVLFLRSCIASETFDKSYNLQLWQRCLKRFCDLLHSL